MILKYRYQENYREDSQQKKLSFLIEKNSLTFKIRPIQRTDVLCLRKPKAILFN